jgi:hypothetical protein
MATTVTTNLSLVYSPPGGPVNSATASFQTASTNNAQNVGVIDIPSGTAPATIFPIPFGSIAVAKSITVNNSTNLELGVRLNGGAIIFNLPAGGVVSISGSVAPMSAPLTAFSLEVTGAVATLTTLSYFVFGD